MRWRWWLPRPPGPTQASGNSCPVTPTAGADFLPCYDYDTDGCDATAPIGADGTGNPGPPLGGDVNGECHDRDKLMSGDLGAALIKIGDVDFAYTRTQCEPAGIPFDPDALRRRSYGGIERRHH
ncbi:NPP1 family protein [Streptomyces tendae]|uniref:NPP1 family protein n=1 Tax=Streptomyces tendae TaxID=1932 RepID=UPI001F10F139|nr:NPP1 family protein [Streptomyces tendae]